MKKGGVQLAQIIQKPEREMEKTAFPTHRDQSRATMAEYVHVPEMQSRRGGALERRGEKTLCSASLYLLLLQRASERGEYISRDRSPPPGFRL